MEAEGIEFKTGVEVGKDLKGEEILKENDAMLMALGSTWPRDLPIPGKEHPFIFVPQRGWALSVAL